MDREQIEQVRRFHRLVTQRAGALETDYLSRGRPLGEARLLFEIGSAGADLRQLRARLGLDSGYLTRLIQSLKAQGLVETASGSEDGRVRRAALTAKGRAERAAYDRLSDGLAASILEPLDRTQRERVATAMAEVERLLRAAAVVIAFEPQSSAAGRSCLDQYFAELAARFDEGFDSLAQAASEEDMAPPTGAFVVARLDGEAIGCGGLKRVDEATGEIKRVWTAPAARGLGVARRMLHKLEQTAAEIGYRRLVLDTNKALTEAHALYLKEGYRDIPRYNDNPYAHRWFEKRLAASD